MHTSFMAHGIVSISVRSTTISAKTWTTNLVAMNDDGSIFELTLFSDKPLEIEGSDHVNHVASAQEPMEVGQLNASERKRLDDIAAAARAERERADNEARLEHQRKGEERERLEAAEQKVRDAAPALLSALRALVDAHAIPSSICKERPAYGAAIAAINLATGEAE